MCEFSSAFDIAGHKLSGFDIRLYVVIAAVLRQHDNAGIHRAT